MGAGPAPRAARWEKAFDVAVNAGTLVSVVARLHSEFRRLAQRIGRFGRRRPVRRDDRLGALVVIAGAVR